MKKKNFPQKFFKIIFLCLCYEQSNTKLYSLCLSVYLKVILSGFHVVFISVCFYRDYRFLFLTFICYIFAMEKCEVEKLINDKSDIVKMLRKNFRESANQPASR